MKDITVVKGGKKKWKKQFAELSVLSAPFFKRLFGPGYETVLQYIYLSGEKNLLSRKYGYFALMDGKPVGQILCCRHEQTKGTLVPMAFDFIASMGLFTTIVHAPSLLNVSSKMAQTEPGQSYLYNLAVYPDYRGQGIGESVFLKACEDGRKQGRTHMVLDVAADNHRAIHLYKRLGFKKFGKNYVIHVREERVEFMAMKWKF